MVIYADTSFLVSLYGQDANSPQAHQIASTLHEPFLFTPLHRHEARNAVRLAVFRKGITVRQSKAVLSTMEKDEQAGILAPTPIPWPDIFEQAEALSAAHTSSTGNRAMDILHVAAALELKTDRFFSFDARQNHLAERVGLTVYEA